MKNAFLKKIISAVVAMTIMSTLTPLGVSAQWRQSTDNTTSCTGYNNTSKGWVWENGKYYYNLSFGSMQNTIIKLSGKTCYFIKSSVMKIGNTIYAFVNNGQTIEEILDSNKEFDSNDNLKNIDDSTNSTGLTEETPSTTSEETSANNSNNNSASENGNKVTAGNGGTNAGNISGGNLANGTTNNVSKSNSNSSVNVSGLPQITQKYSVTVQESAEQTILKLMNEKRKEAGLKPLTMDNKLLTVARYKSNHMIQNNYFSHTNPDGTNWTNWLKAIGYSYTATAENIAYNSYDAVELFNQWWNSSGHRQNMMNPSYTKVGIGVLYGNGKYMGTQEFSN
ncbi:MAG: CAP domain-containing protein [Clostridium butyricum]|nr:CAP domain-containing protein [Clostridium butyricum]